MEYEYAALLLHESGEELNEENISRVLEAARVEVEESRVKALVAALEDVDMDEAISAASSSATMGRDEDEIDEAFDEVEEGDEEAAEDDDDDDDSIEDLFS